jgi:tetratricopeptide (TPR) repeat protein
MRNDQNLKVPSILWYALSLVLLIGIPVRVFGEDQKQLAEMRAEQLLQEADFRLKKNRTKEAVPFLQTYLDRSNGQADQRVLSTAQDIRIKLGRILAQSGDMNGAVSLFESYTTNRPALKWNEAMKLLSGALLEMKQWDKCIMVTTNALAGPPEDVRKEITKAEALAAELAEKAASEDEYQFDKYGNVIQQHESGADAKAVDPSAYAKDDLVILHMNLGEAYRETGQKELSISPYEYVLENTTNSIHKGYAILQVVNSLIAEKDFEKIKTLIPRLYQTDARYDIRVNMALMNAAVALYDAGEYDSSLPLFRMILSRKELLEHLSSKMLPLQIEAGIVPDGMSLKEFREISEKTLLGNRNVMKAVEETWSDDEQENQDINKPKELLDYEALQRTIQNLPPYENEVTYRSAYVYDAVKRPWEATLLFDRVHQLDPSSAIGRQSFYEVLRILLDPLEERSEAEKRGFAYLDRHNEGLMTRQVLYLLSSYYQQHQLLNEVTNLLPRITALVPNNDRDVRRYECELYYQQAVANMVLLDYPHAQSLFEKILSDYPGSHQQENATYWRAVAMTFQQEYEKALPLFEDYLKNYPEGAWIASAQFQRGICRFGMEQYEEAFDCFTTVIEQFPESQVYPDARSLRGDIYGSRGLLDQAIAEYQEAFSAAKNHQQGKYATFQMVRVYKSEKRYKPLIEAVNRYMNRYGDEADIAEGIYWLGKTKMDQGLVDEAMNVYLDAIVRFGGDLEQGGVDSIIAELTQVSRHQLSPEQLKDCRTRLSGIIAENKNQVLELRVRVMLSEIDGTRLQLGEQLLQNLPTLGNAAPPVLSVISDASFELKDYSRAAEIMDMFRKNFSESEYMRSAFKLRAYDLFENHDFSTALALVEEAQARYGTSPDAAWAQLMKGKIAIKTGEYDQARKWLKELFNVPAWRGEPQAEAAYLLGTAEEAAGDLLAAHGWYQRTYFQFKGYAGGRWGAEAYLASARCLQKLGYTDEARNTYRAMLFDKYVRELPAAAVARKALGSEETADIAQKVADGFYTNITISVEQEAVQE